jgi:hypothetical protein
LWLPNTENSFLVINEADAREEQCTNSDFVEVSEGKHAISVLGEIIYLNIIKLNECWLAEHFMLIFIEVLLIRLRGNYR